MELSHIIIIVVGVVVVFINIYMMLVVMDRTVL